MHKKQTAEAVVEIIIDRMFLSLETKKDILVFFESANHTSNFSIKIEDTNYEDDILNIVGENDSIIKINIDDNTIISKKVDDLEKCIWYEIINDKSDNKITLCIPDVKGE